jgi:MoxR-like ATPase
MTLDQESQSVTQEPRHLEGVPEPSDAAPPDREDRPADAPPDRPASRAARAGDRDDFDSPGTRIEGKELGDITAEARAVLETALFEIKRIIVGQERLLERVLVALLSGGHLLIEGVPGLAKTRTVATLAEVLGGTFHRVQFTPDLVPSDLVGTRIWRPDRAEFDTELGPVFCNFLLADEINRAPAKVQSALLEVMQEQQVTIGHTTYPVPDPFLVLATQNPIESEGTYPLPEAQVDRFMMNVVVTYPDFGEELSIVSRSLTDDPKIRRVLSIEQLHAFQRATRGIYVDRLVAEYAVALSMATRRPDTYGVGEIGPYIAYGASPRGSINLVHAARALAVLRGRGYALPQDVAELAVDVLRHRLVLSYQALAEQVTADQLLQRVLEGIPAPRIDLARELPA